MELIETSVFTRQITSLLTDEEYGDTGAVMKGALGSARFGLPLGRGENAAGPVCK